MAVQRKRKAAVDPSPTTSDPIEIAMEAEAANTAADSPARRVLLKQERLIGWQIASERAGYALKVMIGLAGLAVAGAFAVMVWRAAHADGVVIRAFATPPALAAQGVTGEVLAGEVIDQFNVIRAGSDGAFAQRSAFQNSLGQDLRLEIPQTGISLGELDRALRGWLGHERPLSGALTESGGQITLTLRLAGDPPVIVTGPAEDRAKIVRSATEQVFANADPLRWEVYLVQQRRFGPELDAVLQRLRTVGTADERAQGFVYTASTFERTDLAKTLVLNQEAIAIGSENYASGAKNASQALQWMGRWAEAERYADMALQRYRRPQPITNTPGTLQRQRTDVRRRLAFFRGDYAQVMALADANVANQSAGNNRMAVQNLPLAAALTHDLGKADSLLRRAVLMGPTGFPWRLASGYVDAAAGRWPQAVTILSAELPAATAQDRLELTVQLTRAMAETGDVAGAQALIGPTAPDCYPCLIARARVAALAGSPAGADHWFAGALRQGPGFPHAEAEWGEVLLARGDLAAAIAKFEAAHRKGPKFADPISGWGEALLKQGQTKAAVRKFREADKYAPKWGRNHLLWGEALAKLGKAKEARAQFALAARLHLTPAERTQLAAHLTSGAR